MFQCFRFPNIDFERTGSSASMCEKTHFFRSWKIVFFAKPDFILQGVIPQKGNHKGDLQPFFPSHNRSPKTIWFHTTKSSFHFIPLQSLQKGFIRFYFTRGMRKKTIFQSLKNCIFCKAGFVLWVGLGTEKEELQHLISESHKASAKKK